MHKKILISVFCALLATPSFAKVDRKTFEALGEVVIGLYTAEADKAGLTVFNTPDWSDKNLDSTVMWVRNYPYLELRYPGALARTELTVDSLAVILCHEMGHALGKKTKDETRVAPEAESDYFATSDCLKRLWSKYPSMKPSSVVSDADKVMLMQMVKGRKDAAYVYRAISSSLEVARVLYTTKVGIQFKDKSVVRTTLSGYPSEQCRLDTYVAGAMGAPRPVCWFKDWTRAQ